MLARGYPVAYQEVAQGWQTASTNSCSPSDLAAVQRQRELPTRIMQTFQALVQERVSAIVGGAGPRGRLAVPAFVVLLLRLPWALALPARFMDGFCLPRLCLPEGQT
ncbi:MAG TPA: hypothetical protein PKD53_26000 [Chloroflexaceae bacterium]|nr:hypothetical protein [Chloroflexaceae bacterium]